ncbi:MAG: HesB/IscA family protein [Alphaproteobacteria bacterium]
MTQSPPERPAIVTITDNAAEHIRKLIASRGKDTYGVRVSLKTKGCNGLSYALEFADDKQPFDEVVESHGLKILIDPKAIMFLLGTTMDYVDEDLESGFKFVNPNEKGRCGCGESFHV